MGRTAKFAIKAFISISFLAFLVYRTDVHDVTLKIRSADPIGVFSATFLLFILSLPQTIRWRHIIHASGADLGFRPALGTTLVGWFFSQVLPSSIGGDAFRVWYAYRFGVGLGVATYSVILDRLAGLLAVIILPLFFTPWLGSLFEDREPVFGIIGVVTVLLIGWDALMVADISFARLLPQAFQKRISKLSQTARRVFLGRYAIPVVALSARI